MIFHMADTSEARERTRVRRRVLAPRRGAYGNAEEIDSPVCSNMEYEGGVLVSEQHGSSQRLHGAADNVGLTGRTALSFLLPSQVLEI